MRVVLVTVLCLAACKKAPTPAWAALAPGASGAAATPVAVPRLATPPTLDGKLDDFAGAAVLGPFVDPSTGAPALTSPVAAEAHVAYDEKNLYVGFVVHDRAPSSPFQRDDVDPHIWSQASGVEIVLQPGDPGDNKDYVEIQVDVNGAVFDSHFDDYNAPITGSGAARVYGHQDFTSHIERAVAIADGDYWSVEIALPWSALPAGRVAIPPRPGDVWRMNLYSFRDGQQRAAAWSPLRGQGNFHKMSRAGRIQFQP